MKRLTAAVLSLCLISIGLTGCDEKSSVKTEKTTTTPTGSTTVTTETDVKSSGTDKTENKTP